MDYSKIYIELIERSFDRALDGYTEKHHIIPRCMGGDNKPRNIAILTPEEHYLAHQLLVKIYPKNYKLVFAAQAMLASNKYLKRNNKIFGWLRKKYHIANSGLNSPRIGIPPANKGMPMSEEQKKKCSLAKIGKPSNRKGKKASLESRKKMSDSHKGIQSGDKNAFFGKKGKDHPTSKRVLQYTMDGKYLNTFDSIRLARDHVGLKSPTGITGCCKGNIKSSGGFVWKYAIN